MPPKTREEHSYAYLAKKLRRIGISFPEFFQTVAAYSIKHWEGKFIWGQHLQEWAERLQEHQFTCTLAPRKHSKSTTKYAYAMWKIFNFDTPYLEIYYFSYTTKLAMKHTKWIKRYLEISPYFEWKSLSSAETIVDGFNDRGQHVLVMPQGMKEFKRGEHPHIIILDDPLKDPEAKLSVEQIEKITTTFREEIMPMPKEDIGECHVDGTSQDPTDLFWQLEHMKMYDWKLYKAIKENGEALWPERLPLDNLMAKQSNMGKKAFDKEYMMVPVRRGEGYFTDERLKDIINAELVNMRLTEKLKYRGLVVAGLDIGKKRHPSHLSVLKMMKPRKLIQIHSKWFDHVDYNRQVSYCGEAIKQFGIDKLLYDDTRAEFESLKELGMLPKQMKPVVFTGRGNFKIASGFDRVVTNGMIELLSDDRQKRQILAVDNDLKAPSTPDGHGDSFWSNALAIEAAGKPDRFASSYAKAVAG